MEAYGKELILDLHHCDPATFTRDSIGRYFAELCELNESHTWGTTWKRPALSRVFTRGYLPDR